MNYFSLLLLAVPVEMATAEISFVCGSEQAGQLIMIIADMLLQFHFTISHGHYSPQFSDLRLLGLAAHIGARMKLYKLFVFKRARPAYRHLVAMHALCSDIEAGHNVPMLDAAETIGKQADQ